MNHRPSPLRLLATLLALTMLLAALPAAVFAKQAWRTQGQIVQTPHFRIEVLSPALFHITQAAPGAPAPDYAGTPLAGYAARFAKTSFKAHETDGRLVIATERASLSLDPAASDLKTLRAALATHDGAPAIAIDDLAAPDTQNLGGVVASIEEKERNCGMDAMPPGLLSRRGWTVASVGGENLLALGLSSSDVFLFAYGLDYKQALADHKRLLGPIPMVPKWVLGNWFSQYHPYSAADYQRITQRFRQEKMPLDVIICDMNWHGPDWFDTRYNNELFPDMLGFLKWARGEGLRVGFNHHPRGIPADDPRLAQFCQDAGLKREQMKKGVDKRAGTERVFYDTEKPRQHNAYMNIFLKQLMDDGVDLHWIDTGPMSLATQGRYFDYAAKYFGETRRPLLLARQADASLTHYLYPLAFSGDTAQEWKVIATEILANVGGGNSGVAYWSHDIGGFFPGAPTREMFARWIQFGVVSPILRLHGARDERYNLKDLAGKEYVISRQPWDWGREVLESARAAFQLRQRLTPYLYTLTAEAHASGLPLCRGMYLDYPAAPEAYDYKFQYMLGESLLAAPIIETSGQEEKGLATKQVWLPAGTWYDFFSGERHEGGGRVVTVKKNLNEFPLFVKAGAILPLAPYADRVMAKATGPMTLEIYKAAQAGTHTYRLYEDEGESMAFAKGERAWTRIDYQQVDGKRATLTIHPAEGRYKGQAQERAWSITLRGFEAGAKVVKATAGGQGLKASLKADKKRGALTLELPARPIGDPVNVEVE